MKLLKAFFTLSILSLLVSCSSIFEGRNTDFSVSFKDALADCDRSVLSSLGKDEYVYINVKLSGDVTDEKTVSIPASKLDAMNNGDSADITFKNLPPEAIIDITIRIDDRLSAGTNTPLYSGSTRKIMISETNKPVVIKLSQTAGFEIEYINSDTFNLFKNFVEEPSESTVKRFFLTENISLDNAITVNTSVTAYLLMCGHTITATSEDGFIKYGENYVNDSNIYICDGFLKSTTESAEHFVCVNGKYIEFNNVKFDGINCKQAVIYQNNGTICLNNTLLNNCTANDYAVYTVKNGTIEMKSSDIILGNTKDSRIIQMDGGSFTMSGNSKISVYNKDYKAVVINNGFLYMAGAQIINNDTDGQSCVAVKNGSSFYMGNEFTFETNTNYEITSYTVKESPSPENIVKCRGSNPAVILNSDSVTGATSKIYLCGNSKISGNLYMTPGSAIRLPDVPWQTGFCTDIILADDYKSGATIFEGSSSVWTLATPNLTKFNLISDEYQLELSSNKAIIVNK